MSWEDCEEWMRLIGERLQPEASALRFPTEAEWECACRAGTQTRYWWGDEPDTQLARYGWFEDQENEALRGTVPVGSYRPNPWGFDQLHGNVWEWCADWFAERNDADDTVDPKGPAEGSLRVFRGGSWFNSARFVRSAFRDWFTPVNRNSYLGFRLARGQEPAGEENRERPSRRRKRSAAGEGRSGLGVQISDGGDRASDR